MADTVPKPTDAEIDVHGVTHPGKVRRENQDHFLISSLTKQMKIQQTSLREVDGLGGASERVASLSMVADGVGRRLNQISRDQTMAEDLVEQGVLTREQAPRTRWAHVLSSAVGGLDAPPVVTRVVREWGTIVMLCSDGLTKHVSDERIAERLGNLESSKEACEALLQDALDDDGTDNITIVIGRTVPRGARGG